VALQDALDGSASPTRCEDALPPRGSERASEELHHIRDGGSCAECSLWHCTSCGRVCICARDLSHWRLARARTKNWITANRGPRDGAQRECARAPHRPPLTRQALKGSPLRRAPQRERASARALGMMYVARADHDTQLPESSIWKWGHSSERGFPRRATGAAYLYGVRVAAIGPARRTHTRREQIYNRTQRISLSRTKSERVDQGRHASSVARDHFAQRGSEASVLTHDEG